MGGLSEGFVFSGNFLIHVALLATSQSVMSKLGLFDLKVFCTWFFCLFAVSGWKDTFFSPLCMLFCSGLLYVFRGKNNIVIVQTGTVTFLYKTEKSSKSPHWKNWNLQIMWHFCLVNDRLIIESTIVSLLVRTQQSSTRWQVNCPVQTGISMVWSSFWALKHIETIAASILTSTPWGHTAL